MQIFETFKSYFKDNQYIAIGHKYLPNKKQVSINLTKIQERLVLEYSKKFLEELKITYENKYMRLREKESKTKPLTTPHTNIVTLMNKIRDNLVIIRNELDIIEENIQNLTSDISKELKLDVINE